MTFTRVAGLGVRAGIFHSAVFASPASRGATPGSVPASSVPESPLNRMGGAAVSSEPQPNGTTKAIAMAVTPARHIARRRRAAIAAERETLGVTSVTLLVPPRCRRLIRKAHRHGCSKVCVSSPSNGVSRFALSSLCLGRTSGERQRSDEHAYLVSMTRLPSGDVRLAVRQCGPGRLGWHAFRQRVRNCSTARAPTTDARCRSGLSEHGVESTRAPCRPAHRAEQAPTTRARTPGFRTSRRSSTRSSVPSTAATRPSAWDSPSATRFRAPPIRSAWSPSALTRRRTCPAATTTGTPRSRTSA